MIWFSLFYIIVMCAVVAYCMEDDTHDWDYFEAFWMAAFWPILIVILLFRKLIRTIREDDEW